LRGYQKSKNKCASGNAQAGYKALEKRFVTCRQADYSGDGFVSVKSCPWGRVSIWDLLISLCSRLPDFFSNFAHSLEMLGVASRFTI
jgi:hypothetical protein